MPISDAVRADATGRGEDEARQGAPGRPRIAVVLWGADVGGAETVKAALVRAWRRAGVDASIVVVTSGGPLAARLADDGIPLTVVGFTRGRDALLRPKPLARALARVAPDGAVLVDGGHLGAALRLVGYRGRLVGVEHGKVLSVPALPAARRAKDRLERAVGAPFRQADVAVSDFVLAELRRRPHARRLVRIHNGVDLGVFAPAPALPAGRLRVGCAARLVPGKGVDVLLRAGSLLGGTVTIEIAGDGPERERLEHEAERLGLGGVVTFRGRVDAMPAFWRSCGLAVVPSDGAESFSMTALEAMATGLPVVATAVGGIPEVLVDGETGTLVPPGDPGALAAAIARYAADPALGRAHGRAGLERARRCFSLEQAAARYLELFEVDR